MCDQNTVLKVLECPICLRPFTQPRLLPCGHTLCVGCMHPMVRGQYINCPECSKRHKLPPGGVDNLPPNPVVISLLDTLCRACRRAPPEDDCGHCGQRLCEKCIKGHHGREQLLTVLGGLDREMVRVCGAVRGADPHRQNLPVLLEIDRVSLFLHQELDNQVSQLKTYIKCKVGTDVELHRKWAVDMTRRLATARTYHDTTTKQLTEEDSGAETDQVSTVKERCQTLEADLSTGLSESPVISRLRLRFNAANMFALSKLATLEPDNTENTGNEASSDDWADCTQGEGGAVAGAGPATHNRERASVGEAVFQFKVPAISELKDRALSEPCYVRNLPWTVLVMPRNDHNQQKSLGVYLQCNGSRSVTWKCPAKAVFRLVHMSGGKDVTREVQHVFCHNQPDWGYNNFIKFSDLTTKGYMKDDMIIVEIHLEAEPPQGVSMSPLSYPSDTFVAVKVVMETDFLKHRAHDLFDPDTLPNRTLHVMQTDTIKDLYKMVANCMKLTGDQVRLWGFTYRSNKTFRPSPMPELHMQMEQIMAYPYVVYTDQPVYIYVESIRCIPTLPRFDYDVDVLLFMKKYTPATRQLTYCGHVYMPLTAVLDEFLIPIMQERGGFSSKTPLLLYEEVSECVVERMRSVWYNKPLEAIVEEVTDGDILIFQQDEDLSQYGLPTPKDYFRNL